VIQVHNTEPLFPAALVFCVRCSDKLSPPVPRICHLGFRPLGSCCPPSASVSSQGPIHINSPWDLAQKFKLETNTTFSSFWNVSPISLPPPYFLQVGKKKKLTTRFRMWTGSGTAGVLSLPNCPKNLSWLHPHLTINSHG
jgi:hypothetical protein